MKHTSFSIQREHRLCFVSPLDAFRSIDDLLPSPDLSQDVIPPTLSDSLEDQVEALGSMAESLRNIIESAEWLLQNSNEHRIRNAFNRLSPFDRSLTSLDQLPIQLSNLPDGSLGITSDVPFTMYALRGNGPFRPTLPRVNNGLFRWRSPSQSGNTFVLNQKGQRAPLDTPLNAGGLNFRELFNKSTENVSKESNKEELIKAIVKLIELLQNFERKQVGTADTYGKLLFSSDKAKEATSKKVDTEPRTGGLNISINEGPDPQIAIDKAAEEREKAEVAEELEKTEKAFDKAKDAVEDIQRILEKPDIARLKSGHPIKASLQKILEAAKKQLNIAKKAVEAVKSTSSSGVAEQNRKDASKAAKEAQQQLELADKKEEQLDKVKDAKRALEGAEASVEAIEDILNKNADIRALPAGHPIKVAIEKQLDEARKQVDIAKKALQDAKKAEGPGKAKQHVSKGEAAEKTAKAAVDVAKDKITQLREVKRAEQALADAKTARTEIDTILKKPKIAALPAGDPIKKAIEDQFDEADNRVKEAEKKLEDAKKAANSTDASKRADEAKDHKDGAEQALDKAKEKEKQLVQVERAEQALADAKTARTEIDTILKKPKIAALPAGDPIKKAIEDQFDEADNRVKEAEKKLEDAKKAANSTDASKRADEAKDHKDGAEQALDKAKEKEKQLVQVERAEQALADAKTARTEIDTILKKPKIAALPAGDPIKKAIEDQFDEADNRVKEAEKKLEDAKKAANSTDASKRADEAKDHKDGAEQALDKAKEKEKQLVQVERAEQALADAKTARTEIDTILKKPKIAALPAGDPIKKAIEDQFDEADNRVKEAEKKLEDAKKAANSTDASKRADEAKDHKDGAEQALDKAKEKEKQLVQVERAEQALADAKTARTEIDTILKKPKIAALPAGDPIKKAIEDQFDEADNRVKEAEKKLEDAKKAANSTDASKRADEAKDHKDGAEQALDKAKEKFELRKLFENITTQVQTELTGKSADIRVNAAATGIEVFKGANVKDITAKAKAADIAGIKADIAALP